MLPDPREAAIGMRRQDKAIAVLERGHAHLLGKGLLSSFTEDVSRQLFPAPMLSFSFQICREILCLNVCSRETCSQRLRQGRVWAPPRHPSPTLDRWPAMLPSCLLGREGHGGHSVISPHPAPHLPFLSLGWVIRNHHTVHTPLNPTQEIMGT